MQIDEGQSSEVLKLSGALDMQNVDALHAALLERLACEPALALDLSDIDECCTAALQLMYAARKSAARLGKAFSIVGVSAPVVTISEALGLNLSQLPAAHQVDASAQTPDPEGAGGDVSGV